MINSKSKLSFLFFYIPFISALIAIFLISKQAAQSNKFIQKDGQQEWIREHCNEPINYSCVMSPYSGTTSCYPGCFHTSTTWLIPSTNLSASNNLSSHKLKPGNGFSLTVRTDYSKSFFSVCIQHKFFSKSLRESGHYLKVSFGER